ncbi:Pyruvate dehydrogenase E1 component subunit beta [Candidatus Bartonella washoeensis]|uniref:Transketolase C-terminal domain-containing protein n=1 Tax=Candidatus Bartonella washoeensis Sb944nv TaxID=1094563 RepID=J0Z207_9HYPH|nr:transketolase C-terminal domain-containing protein [Bartonella washoeensis]EJF81428.1 hypothetical protein MCQ_00126 [Bartonella washoeensis Sb944nv]SPU27372.1 Pyruvate dehydrogenase E1 component subunit beta [Bartonella washoeensis]
MLLQIFIVIFRKINACKASVIREGKDILLLATGETVHICLDAVEELPKYEVMPTIVSVSTIQPLDGESVLKLCQSQQFFCL